VDAVCRVCQAISARANAVLEAMRDVVDEEREEQGNASISTFLYV
jgi:hypothetical protein